MSPEPSSALIDWFVNHFASPHDGSILGAIVYEMFGLQDAFGQVMLSNLQVFKFLPRFCRAVFTPISIVVKECIFAGCGPVPHGRFAP